MVPLQGIWKSSPLSKQPQGFAFHVLNGLIQEKIGAYTNEKGASEFSEQFNGELITPNGICNAKYNRKIMFGVGQDGQSHIGIINADGTYDSRLIADLGFSVEHPIDAEVQYNFRGDILVAFTDGVQTPKLINLDAIELPFDINDVQLYSKLIQPRINTEVIETGGSLQSGAYYPVFRFKKLLGGMTSWTASGNPVFITEDTISEGYNNYDGIKAGIVTSKSIEISLQNVDVSYDKIVIGLVSKIDGILIAKEITEEVITGDTMTVLVTGNEGGTVIDLKEVITPAVNYATIKHFTQVQGNLYGASVTEEAPLNLQKYANLVKLKFTSEISTVRNINESAKIHAINNKKRGFAHGEVYAFYVRFKLKNKGWTRAFHIPGRAPSGNEATLNSALVSGDTSLQTDLTISPTSRYFQIRDTTTPSTGKFGFWQNENEKYPVTNEYDSTDVSGVDLRGLKVRHHRFPTIRKMKETLYSSNGEYGRTKLDILGIQVETFPDLPSDLDALIEGYEICYAKRSPGNSLVNGMSLTTLGAKRHAANEDDDTNIYSTGGNWNNRERGDGNRRDQKNMNEALYADKKLLRLHSFDLLLNKPAITPSYISNEIKYHKTGIRGNDILAGIHIWAYEIDYLGSNVTVSAVPLADRYKKITDFKYVPSGTISGEVNNFIGEEVAVAKIEGVGLTLGINDNGMNISDEEQSWLGGEETYLTTIMSYKTNMYSSFFNQQLVSTGKYFLLADALTPIFGGDVFIGEFGFVTIAPKIYPELESDDVEGTGGVKTIRSFISEGINNVGLRYEDETNPQTKYYPRQTIENADTWLASLPRGKNPNVLAYNKDYTSVNDLMLIMPHNPYDIFVAEDPYKIIRSKPASVEERHSSWQVFLANDYYIIPRDKGFIANIEGIGEDLYINTEFTLLKTRGSEELATDSFKVVLGTGNIFDRPPIELINDKNGYSGCQHKHSCLVTSHGYFFVDEDKQKIFLTTDKPYDITKGLEDEFKRLLDTTGDNPFDGTGYTVAWDDENERIVFSSLEGDFTYSYYPPLKSWTSSHSYRPNFLIGDRNSLFAIKNNKIYKHNVEDRRGQYYDDTIHPFEIVAIFNPDEHSHKTTNNITWTTEFILNEAEQRDITFDKVLLWNSYQSSGDIDITPFDNSQSYEYNYDMANTRRIKRQWLLNKFRDKVANLNTKFMDGVDVVEGLLTDDKPFNELKKFSDNFLAVKFSFSNKKISNLQGELRVLDLGTSYTIAKR